MIPSFFLAAAPLDSLPVRGCIRLISSCFLSVCAMERVSRRIKSSNFARYSPISTVPLVMPSSPFSQDAVILGFNSSGTVMLTVSKIISPSMVGVSTWDLRFRLRYPTRTSFLIISALVAEVPMPEPLIWARSSSSSISCPAFSMASTMEPEVYRLGGEVLPSLMSIPFTGTTSFSDSFSIMARSVLALVPSSFSPPSSSFSSAASFPKMQR